MMPGDFRVSITNASGKDAYPISSFTYLLVPKQWKDSTKEKAFVDFLTWMLEKGQGMVTQLNYAPLPESIKQKEMDVDQNRSSSLEAGSGRPAELLCSSSFNRNVVNLIIPESLDNPELSGKFAERQAHGSSTWVSHS